MLDHSAQAPAPYDYNIDMQALTALRDDLPSRGAGTSAPVHQPADGTGTAPSVRRVRRPALTGRARFALAAGSAKPDEIEDAYRTTSAVRHPNRRTAALRWGWS